MEASEQVKVKKQKKQQKKFSEMTPQEKRREVISFIVWILAAVAIALCLRFFVFEFVRVEGPSMQPTLYTNEIVFMEKITYYSRTPQRGEVVVCHIEGTGKPVIKRVIAVPGETVEISGGAVYLDGEELPHDVFSGEMDYSYAPVTVPDGHVFVLGDNRNNSKDSHIVGPVPLTDVMGRATGVVLPFSKIGALTQELK